MKRYCLSIVFVCIYTLCQSQSSFDHFFLNNYLLNPAISGIENYTDIQIGYRNQWTGIEGAPSTGYITWHQPISKSGIVPGFSTSEKNKTISRMPRTMKHHPHHGIGASVIMDNIGVFRTQEVGASYALHIPISDGLNASLGVSPAFRFTGLNNSAVAAGFLDDPAIADFNNQIATVLKFGGWIYSKNLFFGASYHSFLSNTDSNATNELYFNVGARFTKHVWSFKPYGIVRRINEEISYDGGVQTTWKDRIWLGVTYRDVSEIIYYVGVNITPLLSATFLINDPLQNSLSKSVSSQEVVVQFRLNNREKVLCPQKLW